MTQQGVISVLPEHRYELHTTRTPLFLGLDVHSANLFPENGASSDDVVGFSTPVFGQREKASPTKDSLIGARFFARGSKATMGPVDESKEYDGHRTHTSSTAAGSIVEGASLLGFANGTARGMALLTSSPAENDSFLDNVLSRIQIQ
ncbi:unnamed protein product [Microthlaspi erraticum]|uniref:Peptidase S8/S53 domain-containing protein n=1 Tax=Microthlaspi erraticum TaxID=1685480 RepID=A0A6D2IQI1_9BRAS|nr:unnamed protein product [Microthlaspi erraticum]